MTVGGCWTTLKEPRPTALTLWDQLGVEEETFSLDGEASSVLYSKVVPSIHFIQENIKVVSLLQSIALATATQLMRTATGYQVRAK